MTDPALIFFSESEAATVDAMAARIIPTDTSGPGAREAGVIDYIDRALSGYYRDLQTFYRRGVRVLDALCHERFGAGFRALGEDQQDAVLASVERWADDETNALLRMFFAVVCRHTIEGLFCDPAYGGNRDLIGWRLVGFPGAQWSYSAEQMRPGFDSRQIPIKTLEDLRREHGTEVSHGRAH
jgi:gluconate 2-dehydrogenase gamma chain